MSKKAKGRDRVSPIGSAQQNSFNSGSNSIIMFINNLSKNPTIQNLFIQNSNSSYAKKREANNKLKKGLESSYL